MKTYRSIISKETEIPVATPSTIKSVSESINFVIDEEITYLDTTHFKTNRGIKYYNEAKLSHKNLGRLQTEIDDLRVKYGSSTSYSEKQSLGEKILSLETEIYELQAEINELFLKAKQVEAEYWQNAPENEKKAFLSELVNLNQVQTEANPLPEATEPEGQIDPMALLIGNEPVPQPEESGNEELLYKIQLGAYSRGLPTYVKRLFDKLSYIRKIENYTDEKGIVVYTTGNLKNYVDALKMQEQVRQEGVEDAYVVPYFNGKRITLKEAREIEAGK